MVADDRLLEARRLHPRVCTEVSCLGAGARPSVVQVLSQGLVPNRRRIASRTQAVLQHRDELGHHAAAQRHCIYGRHLREDLL